MLLMLFLSFAEGSVGDIEGSHPLEPLEATPLAYWLNWLIGAQMALAE